MVSFPSRYNYLTKLDPYSNLAAFTFLLLSGFPQIQPKPGMFFTLRLAHLSQLNQQSSFGIIAKLFLNPLREAYPAGGTSLIGWSCHLAPPNGIAACTVVSQRVVCTWRCYLVPLDTRQSVGRMSVDRAESTIDSTRLESGCVGLNHQPPESRLVSEQGGNWLPPFREIFWQTGAKKPRLSG